MTKRLLPARRHRLEFYCGGREAGTFQGRSYPTTTGVFPYAPFRGPGHARMRNLLKEGERAECWFRRARKRFCFLVSDADFVAEAGWLLTIEELDLKGTT